MAKSEPKKQRGWLNKSEMAASLGISVQAFDKWRVEPREAFYTARSVIENRLAHAERSQQPEDEEDGGTDARLQQERLRLTAAQAEGQELKNEVTKRNLVPVEFATFSLTRLAAEVASILDTLPLTLKRKHPDFETRHMDTLQRELAKARNLAASLDERLDTLLDDYLASADL